MGRRFQCHKISEGCAEAEALVSKDHIMFYLIEPKTGTVIEKAHDLEGKTVAGKALVFPGGKEQLRCPGRRPVPVENPGKHACGHDYPASGNGSGIQRHYHGDSHGG